MICTEPLTVSLEGDIAHRPSKDVGHEGGHLSDLHGKGEREERGVRAEISGGGGGGG